MKFHNCEHVGIDIELLTFINENIYMYVLIIYMFFPLQRLKNIWFPKFLAGNFLPTRDPLLLLKFARVSLDFTMQNVVIVPEIAVKNITWSHPLV